MLCRVSEGGRALQRIRPALVALREDIGIEHALASKRLYTDGAEIIFDFGRSHGDSADIAQELVVVRNNQRMFSEVVQEYLQRMEFGDDGYVRLIRLPNSPTPMSK